jgi:hypothetical protein
VVSSLLLGGRYRAADTALNGERTISPVLVDTGLESMNEPILEGMAFKLRTRFYRERSLQTAEPALFHALSVTPTVA